jgi:hypothetical protein
MTTTKSAVRLDEVMSFAQAAAMLQRSEARVRQMAGEGLIQTVTDPTGRRLVLRASVEQRLAQRASKQTRKEGS